MICSVAIFHLPKIGSFKDHKSLEQGVLKCYKYSMPRRPKQDQDTLNPLLTPEEIGLCLDYLGLSGPQAGKLLGGGNKAFLKYSKNPGAITKAMSNLLRVLVARPSALDVLAKGEPLDVARLRQVVESRKRTRPLLARLTAPQRHSGKKVPRQHG